MIPRLTTVMMLKKGWKREKKGRKGREERIRKEDGRELGIRRKKEGRGEKEEKKNDKRQNKNRKTCQ